VAAGGPAGGAPPAWGVTEAAQEAVAPEAAGPSPPPPSPPPSLPPSLPFLYTWAEVAS
jgi:hypothetical protein